MTGSLVSPGTRQRVRDAAVPIATALGRLGLTPNALTVIGFVGTAAAAYAASQQAWLAAGVLVLAFGIFDLFDGALARATNQVSRFGAFLDSTLDRSGEALTYVGIAAGCINAGYELGAFLAAAALASSQLVPYVRAKAESLGYAPGSGMMNVGLAPREVRLAFLTLTLFIAGQTGPLASQVVGTACSERVSGGIIVSCPDLIVTNPANVVLAAGLGLIAILAIVTTIQRILVVRAQAKEG